MEVSKLGLPHDQSIGTGHSKAQLKTWRKPHRMKENMSSSEHPLPFRDHFNMYCERLNT